MQSTKLLHSRLSELSEEEKGIMPFLGQLGQICTIHPEDVQKMREFLLGQTLGTVELILIIVVLVGLVAIFKKQLVSLVNNILAKITKQSNSI